MNPTLPLLFAATALLPFVAWQDPQKKPPVILPTEDQLALATLRKLAWLSGTWVLQDGRQTTEEHWRPLQGTTMLGSSHTFDNERTHFFEHLRITATGASIAYLAMPGGAAPTSFRLTRLEDGVVEFENGKHDHPQRIRYEQTKAGVTATICQLDGSRAQSFVFTKKKKD